MSTVYLHIGRGKTGTTAIQRAIGLNRDHFLSQGINYLLADDRASGIGHQDFAKCFMHNYPDYMIRPESPSQTLADVEREIKESRCPQILISSENFTLADVSEVRKFFTSIKSVQRVIVIFFVRSQDELAELQYNQMVKMTGETASFWRYINEILDETDYYEMANRWADIFGDDNLICRIYDAGANDTLEVLMECMGVSISLPVTMVKSAGGINKSIGYFQLQFMLTLNRLKLKVHPWTATQDLVRRSKRDFPALLFDVEEAREFRERFSISNRHFSERFLGVGISDLGGRKYSDERRREIRRTICEANARDIFSVLQGENLARNDPH